MILVMKLNGINDMRNLEEIRAVIADNRENDRPTYEGLDSAEIGVDSRASMFGDNGEGYPGDSVWSSIVD
jgi:hypothetical protein